MRSIGRIVLLAITIAFAANGVRAQDPDATAQASKPIPAATPGPEAISEPAEVSVTPLEDAAPDDGAVEAAAAGSLGDASTPPSSGDPGPAPPKIDVEPLALAAAPAVDTSAISAPLAEGDPAQGKRVSDWIFLGVLALSAAVILARLTRRQRESLSILDRAIPPSSAGPPVVRHS